MDHEDTCDAIIGEEDHLQYSFVSRIRHEVVYEEKWKMRTSIDEEKQSEMSQLCPFLNILQYYSSAQRTLCAQKRFHQKTKKR